MTIRNSVLLVFALLISTDQTSAQYAGAVPAPENLSAGFQSISEDDSKAFLSTLVSEEFSGRGTGQEGYLKAAKWFAERLAENGFEPAGTDGSWFQNVPFVRISVQQEAPTVTFAGTTLVEGKQTGMSRYFGVFEQELPVTIARVGAERPPITDGQFSGQLLVVQGPGGFRGDDEWIQKAKPACVLFVVPAERLRSESVNRLEEAPLELPSATISIEGASKLAETCGANAGFFSEGSSYENVLVQSSRHVAVHLKIDRESVDVPNVVGWYPGSDESCRHEHVGIGAHLDHLGSQLGDVFPGADDNGSGSTAILQIAKAIHLNPVKPRRSVLLMAFCAEERGLLGSKYYAENPLRPLSDMVCMLNIDMIGRNEETDTEPASENENTIHLVGSKQISEALHNMVMDANSHVNFVFEYDEERVYTRSDHASFAAKGVPITFLFGGFNPHYHKTTDTLEGINFAKICNAARLNYLTLMLAAEHGHFEKNKPAEEEKPAGE
ncbi:MAG: M28 family peptidase [Planctomyces sp.]|nr:M28 family peptidase [Planctomyces sp.]